MDSVEVETVLYNCNQIACYIVSPFHHVDIKTKLVHWKHVCASIYETNCWEVTNDLFTWKIYFDDILVGISTFQICYQI